MERKRPTSEAPFERFRELAKKVVSTPKSEIDKRAKDWKESRERDKGETANE